MAAEGIAPPVGARVVRAFRTEGGAQVDTVAAHLDIAQPANLVVEDDSAKTRKVSVELTDMTLADALDEIAAASGCNIFKDADNIVVDYCKPQ